MKRYFVLILYAVMACSSVRAQRVLSLDDCREMAVSSNAQMAVAKVKGDISHSLSKSTKTMSLPRVSAVLGYQHFGREISLLNNEQKQTLSTLGTSVASGASTSVQDLLTGLAMKQVITPEQAQTLGQSLGQMMGGVENGLNGIGDNIKNALRTDSRNMYAGAITLMQPIYMGGAVSAANEMAKISEKISETTLEQTRQNTLFEVDNAYWLVVQLAHKKELATQYVELLKKLESDVKKMIDEGVATRADGLKVSVAVNEAEMTLLKIDDGVRLAKMLVCQKCGLPLETEIALEDESGEFGNNSQFSILNSQFSKGNRPELQLLEHAANLSKQSVKMVKAMNRPQVLATAGFLVTNPSVYNGFEKKFGANWNIGVMARVPLWDWNDNEHKVNAAKAMTTIVNLELQEANELIELQIAQNKFKLSEAQRQLTIAEKNIEKAEENMRCADLGFREGVMTSTDVMAAQTAWMQAKTQKIDAQIGIILADIGLRKAMGIAP